jgi:hypothetical protein
MTDVRDVLHSAGVKDELSMVQGAISDVHYLYRTHRLMTWSEYLAELDKCLDYWLDDG